MDAPVTQEALRDMDALIVVDPAASTARCVKLRDIRKGDEITTVTQSRVTVNTNIKTKWEFSIEPESIGRPGRYCAYCDGQACGCSNCPEFLICCPDCKIKCNGKEC